MLTNEKQGIEKLIDKGGVSFTKDSSGNHNIFLPKDIVNPPVGINPSSPEFRDKFNKTMTQISQGSMVSGKVPSPDEYLNLFNYYINSVLESKTSQRIDRYRQMDFILKNDAALSQARNVLKDEIMQEDVFSSPITVTAKNYAFKKRIIDLLKNLGIKSLIKEAAHNLISYGDAFWLMDARKKQGVTKIIPTSPYDIKHRFEFSVAEIKAQRKKMLRRFNGLQALIDAAASVESRAVEFNKVLLGFQVLDSVFPFWQVCHFRRFTTDKDLEPFGMPMFYECQSEARMYLNAKVIISMIRSSAFMKEHIKVKTSPTMDPADQWMLVNDVRQMVELYTSKNGRTNKDLPSFGDKLYYPEGLMDVTKLEAGFNFRDRFEDLQLMREDVFNATGLPKGYFVGESGYTPVKALMMQDKKTARKVFDLQSIIISQIVKIVETHFTLTGEFNPDVEEFSISLPYPIPDFDETMITIAQAKAQYAVSVMDGLKQTLGIPKIPEPVVRQILFKYFSFDDEGINSIVSSMEKASMDMAQRGIDPIGISIGDPYLSGKDMADQAEIQTQMMAAQAANPEAMMQPGEEGAEQPPQPEGQEQGASEQQATAMPKEESLNEAEAYRHYNSLYESAIKEKPLKEALEETFDKFILEKASDEFVYLGRHYVSSTQTSPDHNQHLYVDEKQYANFLKKTSGEKLGELSEEEMKEEGDDPLECMAKKVATESVYKIGDRLSERMYMTKDEVTTETLKREAL
jgi:hypothetical protein